MLFSRLKPALATLSRQGSNVVQKRQGHIWSYREPHPGNPRIHYVVADLMGGLMWWWILTHLWYQFDHVVGHHTIPDPAKWTDEELGIPPDEEEL